MKGKGTDRWIWGAVGMLVVGLLVSFPALPPASAGARNPCVEPGNLTRNCGFDSFADQDAGGRHIQVPADWNYFILSGSPDYRTAVDTYWGAPSLWMVTDGVPFTAGLYQQVPVTRGVVYQTDIGWAAQDKPDFERKLGLDPTGGTNPQAASVVWSRSEAGFDKWPDLTVSARAIGPTMTVFLWVSHQTTHGVDSIFLDAVGLWPDTSQPAATVTPKASPTPTRRPPTRTPSQPKATVTPTALPPSPTPTDTSVPTDTPIPTDTSTPTPTPTWTITPTPAPPTATPWPTRTPLPTIEVVALAVGTPDAELAASSESTSERGTAPGTVWAFISLGALAVAVILAGLVVWLRMRSREASMKQDTPESEE